MNAMVRHAGRHVRRQARKVWESRGGGFYGFVAMLTFLWLEAVDLGGDVAGLGAVRLDLGTLIGWVVGNMVDAVLNLIWSALWPLEWLQRFGIGLLSAGLLAGAYVIYRAIRPTVIRLLREPGEPAPEGVEPA